MRPSNKCLEKFISFVILSKFLFLQKEIYKNEMEIEKRVFFLKYKEHFFMLLCFLCFEMNNNVEAKKKKKYYIHEATTLILKLIIISTQARIICQEGKTVEIFLLK